VNVTSYLDFRLAPNLTRASTKSLRLAGSGTDAATLFTGEFGLLIFTLGSLSEDNVKPPSETRNTPTPQ
jgi:hypothetical protein